MYVDPFVCGMIAAVLIELGVSLVGTAYFNFKERKEQNPDDDQEESN